MSPLHETNSPRGRDTSWAKPQVGTFLLAVLAVVAAVYALRAAESVLKPLAFAWVLVGLLSPMVRGLVRLRLPRSLAILLLQFLISAATGLAVWLVLWALGIDFAMTWGALAFILNFIPTIGSILATIPPVLMALVQHAPEHYWPVIVVAVVLLTIQMMIGNVVAPRILGEHMNLSPEVVLISLLFWGWLWGPGGALLSVPITASIKIICDNVAPLKPWGVMLGSGRGLPEHP